MRVSTTSEALANLTADALIVIYHEEGAVAESTNQIDSLMGGKLSRMVASGDLSVKLGKIQTIYEPTGLATPLLVVVGGGSRNSITALEASKIAGSALKRLGDRKRSSVVLAVDGLTAGEPSANVLSAAIAAAMNGAVGQDVHRTEKNLKGCDELVLWGMRPTSSSAVERGQVIGRAQLLARHLVNAPPNEMYPEAFVQKAREVCGEFGIEIEVWDEMRLRRENCGSLLAVAQGSIRPPRLVIMRYRGHGSSNQAPLALVGKGVTFDSGGYSIKPTDGMLTMKCDMAGAATVLATMQAIAELKLPVSVVGAVGLVENLISGSAFKLGDVLKSRAGTTIEVHNTDAEGRLVLADVLHVTLDEKPSKIIDLATLTGACVVALGTDIAGLMGNDSELLRQFETAAERAGEYVWPLPMHAFFDEQISGQVADIKNVGDGRWGGAITAAKFLERFVGSTPWLHVDIAGPAFADKPKSHLDGGGTGCMLKSLVEFIDPTSR